MLQKNRCTFTLSFHKIHHCTHTVIIFKIIRLFSYSHSFMLCTLFHLYLFTQSFLHLYLFTHSFTHLYLFTQSFLHLYVSTHSFPHLYSFTQPLFLIYPLFPITFFIYTPFLPFKHPLPTNVHLHTFFHSLNFFPFKLIYTPFSHP